MPFCRWIIKLGQEYFSLRRLATMPTTPWCHTSLESTRALRSCWGRNSICSTAWAKMSCSTAWRSRLRPHSSRAMRSASSGSPVSSRSAASSASPMRPAALIRGARTKPICTEEISRSASPVSRSRAWRPRKSELPMASSPRWTMVRFSSVICITSATVPMAARVQ